MPKKIKFALKMKDGVEVRSLQELQENFDLNQVTAYFLDGKLETWLEDRYYDEELEKLRELDKADSQLQKELCHIFGVEYEADSLTIEEIEARNRKLARLKEITDDEEILAHVDSVAFSQEELADLLDEGIDTIYLCGNDFVIPDRVKDKTYIGIQTELDISREKRNVYEKNGIRLINLFGNTSDLEDKNYSDFSETQDEDVDLVLLCDGYPNGEDKNFLVSIGKEKEVYQPGISGIQYRALMKKIKTPNILRYCRAVYNGEKIIFKAENGQGEFLAEMDVQGKHMKILTDDVAFRVWFGSKGMLMSGGSGEKPERLFHDGAKKDMNKIDGCLWDYIDLPDGWYTIHYLSWGMDLQMSKLKNEETQAQRFEIALERQSGMLTGYGYSGYKFVGASKEKGTNYIYIWIGNDRRGYFYRFDTRKNEMSIACRQPVYYDGTCKVFCVKGDNIYYYGGESEKNNSGKIMCLNMESGRQKCLWDIDTLMKMDNHEPIREFAIVGEYLYFIRGPHTDNIGHMYRIKLDGSERTIIGKPFGEFELTMQGGNINSNRPKDKTVEDDVEKIVRFCWDNFSIIGRSF